MEYFVCRGIDASKTTKLRADNSHLRARARTLTSVHSRERRTKATTMKQIRRFFCFFSVYFYKCEQSVLCLRKYITRGTRKSTRIQPAIRWARVCCRWIYLCWSENSACANEYTPSASQPVIHKLMLSKWRMVAQKQQIAQTISFQWPNDSVSAWDTQCS